MKNKVLLLLTSFLLLCNFQCGEEICADPATNRSAVAIEVFPEQLAYAIGDTIWFSSLFDTELELLNSDQIVDATNGNGTFQAIIAYLDDGAEITRGFSDFDIENDRGMLDQRGIEEAAVQAYEGNIRFDCDALNCAFRIGLIPQIAGNYAVTMAFGQIDIEDPAECPAINRLENSGFEVSSHNRQLYDTFNLPPTIRLPQRLGSNLWDVRDSDATFTFRVEE